MRLRCEGDIANKDSKKRCHCPLGPFGQCRSCPAGEMGTGHDGRTDRGVLRYLHYDFIGVGAAAQVVAGGIGSRDSIAWGMGRRRWSWASGWPLASWPGAPTRVADVCGPALVDVAFPVCLWWLEIGALDPRSQQHLLGHRCPGSR